MKKFLNRTLVCFLIMFSLLPQTITFAESGTYKVASGDTMWKIAVKHQIGLSELIKANSQIANPDIIYPGNVISIPNIDDIKAVENEVIRLVNVERAKLGLSLLSANWELSRVARYKSQDMLSKEYFSHQSPTYGSPFVMMDNFGIKFSAAGENIAYGQTTAAAVMNSWMNSPGHRSNILSATYNQIGVGIAKAANGTYYWTQMFIKSIY